MSYLVYIYCDSRTPTFSICLKKKKRSRKIEPVKQRLKNVNDILLFLKMLVITSVAYLHEGMFCFFLAYEISSYIY